jgi:hypothetical protein
MGLIEDRYSKCIRFSEYRFLLKRHRRGRLKLKLKLNNSSNSSSSNNRSSTALVERQVGMDHHLQQHINQNSGMHLRLLLLLLQHSNHRQQQQRYQMV